MLRGPNRILIALTVALASLIAVTSGAHAQRAMDTTIITVLPIDGPVRAGQEASVSVRLTTTGGTPVTGVGIQLFITSAIQKMASTDANGIAVFNVRMDANPGTYKLVFTVNGAAAFQESSASGTIIVVGSSNSRLEIEPLGEIPMGKSATITARLTTDRLEPVQNERLALLIDGQPAEVSITDVNGEAHLNSGRDLSVGTHKILVTYDGSRTLGPASATLELGVNSLEVEVHTIPVLEGVRFSLDGRTFTSDQNGVARIKVNQPGTYHIEVLPYETSRTNIRVQFGGWADQTYTPYHDVNIPGSGPVEAGFNLSYKAGQKFVDLAGQPVDPKRITSMTFKRSDGGIYTFDNGEPRWLEVNHVVHRAGGLLPSLYQYSLMSVMVNGTNVVSEQQQRFYVNPDDEWTLALLLFTAQFKAHDTLFGFPLGDSIELIYPDKTVVNPKLDSNAETRVVSLPRGNYKVSVKTRMGIAPVSPLAMSRDQVVDLPIVSWYDIGAGVLLALLLGPGILLIGQPRLRAALLNIFSRPRFRRPRVRASD